MAKWSILTNGTSAHARGPCYTTRDKGRAVGCTFLLVVAQEDVLRIYLYGACGRGWFMAECTGLYVVHYCQQPDGPATPALIECQPRSSQYEKRI